MVRRITWRERCSRESPGTEAGEVGGLVGKGSIGGGFRDTGVISIGFSTDFMEFFPLMLYFKGSKVEEAV